MGEGGKRCAYIITLPLPLHEGDALQEGAEQHPRVVTFSPLLQEVAASLETRRPTLGEGDTGLAGLLESD